MAVNPTIFSIQGRGLKLDSRADIAPILAEYDPAVIEEIHFGGNTIGIEAAQALAEFLQKTKVLKVRRDRVSFHVATKAHAVTARWPILQTSSPVA